VERLRAEEIVGEEWAEWYALSPAERFLESAKLWETYLALGGSLEPEPDTQSPFFDPEEWRQNCSWAARRACSTARRNSAATWIC